MAEKRGRKAKYKSCKEIEKLIEDYFISCEGKPLTDENGDVMTDKRGNPVIVDRHPPTVTGLALALGFTNRLDLMRYQGKPEFCNTITRAKARVEQYAEERLFDNDGTRGAQFSLKCNFGWNDNAQSEQEAPDDGFISALNGKAAEDWSGGDE